MLYSLYPELQWNDTKQSKRFDMVKFLFYSGEL